MHPELMPGGAGELEYGRNWFSKQIEKNTSSICSQLKAFYKVWAKEFTSCGSKMQQNEASEDFSL